MTPQTLDWKYPDLCWRGHRDRVGSVAHADVFADVRMDGFAPLCEREGPTDGRRYLIAVRDGYHWLIRYADEGQRGLEAVRTDLRYHDDVQTIEVQHA